MHPAFGAIGPRDRGNEFGLVLPEVQMPPSPLPAVVDAALLAAAGTGELHGAFEEISRDGALFGIALEGAGGHRPRMRERKRLREELIRVHA